MNNEFWLLAAEIEQIKERIVRARANENKARKTRLYLEEKLESLLLQLAQLNSPKGNSLKEKTLTESILEVVKDINHSLSVSDILYRITGGGFKFTSKDPYTNVYVMCVKLAKRGLIKEISDEGKRMFAKK